MEYWIATRMALPWYTPAALLPPLDSLQHPRGDHLAWISAGAPLTSRLSKQKKRSYTEKKRVNYERRRYSRKHIMAYLLSVAARACASSSLSRTYSSSAADLDDLDGAFVEDDMIDGGVWWRSPERMKSIPIGGSITKEQTIGLRWRKTLRFMDQWQKGEVRM